MRKALLLLPLLSCASPGLAQPVRPVETFQLPPELSDPAAAQRLAGAIEAASQALLNVKIGPMRAAIEGRETTSRERNETLGDLVRREDPNFDRNVQREIATAGPKIQRSLKALNEALPQMARGLADAQQALDRAVANLPDPTYPRR